MIGIVGTPVSYAPYVEFGTYKMKAQSFLRAALDRRRKDIREVFRRAIKKGLKSGK